MTPSTSMNLSCTEGDDSIGSSNTTKSSSNTGSFDTSFNLSFASDNTDDDDEIGPSDSFDDVFSTPPIIIRPLCRPLPKGVGLGFSGVMNKDGDGPLTGLGPLTRTRHPWFQDIIDARNAAAQKALDERLASRSTDAHVPETELAVPIYVSGDMELSKTFRREAVLTFTEDPFHESSLAPIPECNSWYELVNASDTTQDHADQPEHLVLSARQTCGAHVRSRSPRSAGNFLSATISSELKRSTSSVNRLGFNASRTRSASWPAQTVPLGRSRVSLATRSSTSSLAKGAWRF